MLKIDSHYVKKGRNYRFLLIYASYPSISGLSKIFKSIEKVRHYEGKSTGNGIRCGVEIKKGLDRLPKVRAQKVGFEVLILCRFAGCKFLFRSVKVDPICHKSTRKNVITK